MARKSKKRANGEGSIYKRKDGRWAGQYTTRTGKLMKIHYVYGKTKDEVRRKLTKVLAERDEGLVFEAGNLTLGEYLEGWLKDSVRHSVKPTTFESYSQLTSNHIIPALGRNKLKGLTTDHVRRFRSLKLEEGLSTRTVQNVLTLLHMALKQAVNDGLIPRNVAQGVKVKQARKHEIRYLNPVDVKALLRAARGDRLEAMYVLAIHCGLRQGELMGLKWEDIDLKAGTLSVRRTLCAAKDSPRFSEPKTPKSRRSLKLTAQAIEALERHQATQSEERARLGTLWEDTDLVFRSVTSTPLNRHNLVARSFKPLLEKAGLPRTFCFHNLRHTAASLLFSKGTHPKMVQELLGHAQISVTLEIYSHLIPGMGDKVARDMEDALS